MAQQNHEQAETLKVTNMYMWRLNRHEAEKREESVHREIMRRQHAN